ncbi:MAG: hypothetical protein CTY16_11095 [Methylobacter sp.]|nr:MAG: hypothetical protein CTY16_11095 [Methylobacter sp.]
MTTKRRGRPPSDGQKKTSAEYQRAYRERKKQTPNEEKTAYFSVTGQMVDELDAIATYFELSRAKAANDLLISTLRWMLPEFVKIANEFDQTLKNYPTTPSPEVISEIKKNYWQLLTKSINESEQQ